MDSVKWSFERMPCDTIQTINVDLSKAVRNGKANVIEALKSLGFAPVEQGDLIRFGSWWINHKTGEAKLPDAYAGGIAPAIGKTAALSMAKKFGWKVKEQPDGKLLMQKASF